MKNSIKKIISFEDKLYTIRVLIEYYLLMKISFILGDKFFLFLIVNICLFYAPLEKNFPHFMFKCIISIKQIIEGTLVLIGCFIPKYEERPLKEKID